MRQQMQLQTWKPRLKRVGGGLHDLTVASPSTFILLCYHRKLVKKNKENADHKLSEVHVPSLYFVHSKVHSLFQLS